MMRMKMRMRMMMMMMNNICKYRDHSKRHPKLLSSLLLGVAFLCTSSEERSMVEEKQPRGKCMNNACKPSRIEMFNGI
jgi:uncharacterized membrane protein